MRVGERLRGVLGDDADTEALVTKVLGVALVVSLCLVVGFAIAPFGAGDSYTEFYVLGPNGTASDYPETLTVGESATVLVGVENHESRSLTYTFRVRTNGTVLEKRSIGLAPDERYREPVSIAFDAPGRKRLLLELGLDGQTRWRLRLFVDVVPE